jgi:hypothetical protein
MVPSSCSHTFFDKKWILPSKSETAKIGQKTEGLLGVKGFKKISNCRIF